MHLPLLCLALCAATLGTPAAAYEVRGKTIADLRADLDAHRVTAEALVAAYLARIHAEDGQYRAVLAINPHALADARAADRAARAHEKLGPLHGIPILVKDNIETADPMPTTAGSLALAGNITHRDAPAIARLRAAGAIILGKTNLSEWANIRSDHSVSGWSAVGGQTRNPYDPARSVCGSSAGSAAAVAAWFAPAAVGTETDGSITCPVSLTGLVGLKPTVGLIPRTHIVPISSSQDTAGPMTHTVADAALLLGIMAGSDPGDEASHDADAHRADYASLDPHALAGKRFGVLRFYAGYHPQTDAVFAQALARLQAAGATLVEIPAFPAQAALDAAENTVLMTEFKADLAAYLAGLPQPVGVRNLAELIAFNTAHADRELQFFGQETFVKSEATNGLTDPDYLKARDQARLLAGAQGIDKMLNDNHLDALVAPTMGPAWVIDMVNGDHILGGGSQLAAVARYPHLSVPMGEVSDLPVGLSFMGPAWSEARLLGFGQAFAASAAARPAR